MTIKLSDVRRALMFSVLCLSTWLNLVYADNLQNDAAGKSAMAMHLMPEDIAVVVNDADPLSVKVADYYRVARAIPKENIVHISLPSPTPTISALKFQQLKSDIEKQLNFNIQAVLFVWTAPFAVECNSITAAYTFGFNEDVCKNSCAPTKQNPYFNTASKKPFHDYGMRISMLLPIQSFEKAKAVIDRGVQSDGGVAQAKAYYLQTSDVNRNSRAIFFPQNGLKFAEKGLSVVNIKSDKLTNAQDVMIYQTGLVSVEGLETLKFLPGALADHLTSFGGDLYGTSGQMSALRWLDVGATASYGTVSEPCNYWQKFPNASSLLQWYVSGDTAIEAYWKSVAWPMQGLFVGEPLAAPYAKRVM